MEDEITYTYQPPQVTTASEDVPLILHDQQYEQNQTSSLQQTEQSMPIYNETEPLNSIPQTEQVPQYNSNQINQVNQINQNNQNVESYNPQNMYQNNQMNYNNQYNPNYQNNNYNNNNYQNYPNNNNNNFNNYQNNNNNYNNNNYNNNYGNYQQPQYQPQMQQTIKVPDTPCQMYCAHCDELVISKVEYENGCLVYLFCCILCAFGFLCLALIPCCLNQTKDVYHKWFVFFSLFLLSFIFFYLSFS